MIESVPDRVASAGGSVGEALLKSRALQDAGGGRMGAASLLRNAAATAGFTIRELLLVVSIAVITLGVAVPNVVPMLDGYRLNTPARMVAGRFPRLTPDLNYNGMSISMVAGTDLRISGHSSSTYSGLHYAGHQIAFSGSPLITGNVIADNNADTGSPRNMVERESGGYMKISGNPTIVAPSGGSGFGVRAASAWRECRGAAVATPCG